MQANTRATRMRIMWKPPEFLSSIAAAKTTAICLTCAAAVAFAPVQSDVRPIVEPAQLAGLAWRAIGPAVCAGRVVDVPGVPGRPGLLYVGSASAGLYKSTNGGITFDSDFNDGGTLSIGATAVQPDTPDVIEAETAAGVGRN